MTAPAARTARLLGLLLGLTALSGCAETSFKRLHVLDSRAGPERPDTYLGMPLRTGQVVLSEAPGAYSFLFSLAPERHYDFTHAAILVMEGGEPFVYEMTGEYKLGLDERPTDGIEGTCRRTPFMDYCGAYLYVEVFEPPPGVDGERVGAWVKRLVEREPPFDPYFDWTDHERLFCSEFVQLALEAGGGAPVELIPVRQQPSLQRLLAWLGVARDRCLPAGLYADPGRSVAALGLLPTKTSAMCYFAAKEELHRRFRDDQRLGNLFQMEGMADIQLRPQAFAFLQRAVNLFDRPGSRPERAEITVAVRGLAAEMFGEAPAAPAETPEEAR